MSLAAEVDPVTVGMYGVNYHTVKCQNTMKGIKKSIINVLRASL